MNEEDGAKFTCKVCSGHTLIVTHVWTVLAGEDTERWQEWGPLKSNHHWQYDFKEQIEDNAEDEVERGDFGEYEEDDSDSEPDTYEIYEPETDRESDEFYVNCENCDREIEFGWSQPDRRGLIFPVEFSDFNPAECWPDPKYIQSWLQKEWVRSAD